MTLSIHPVAIEIGIIAIQKIVSHPLTRYMKTGSPWIEAHRNLATLSRPPDLAGHAARSLVPWRQGPPAHRGGTGFR